MTLVRKHWFGVALAALLVVGGSYVGAQAMSSDSKVTLTQAQSESPEGPAMKEGRRGGKIGIGGRRLVRSDALVQDKDGTLQNVRTDHGVLESVNETTLRIKEADGSTVDVPTTADTRIVRDGEAAKVSDLKAGDHVWTVRVKDESGEFATRRVRAVSPERMTELESKRAERREQRQQKQAS